MSPSREHAAVSRRAARGLPGARAAFLCSLAVTATSSAAARETGFEVGLRLGVSKPGGSIGRRFGNLDSRVQTALPLQLDLGYRVIRKLMIGVYASYAPGLALHPGHCDGCSVSVARAGLQAQWHFRAGTRFDPWVGGAAGYEWLLEERGGGPEVPTPPLSSVRHGGFEFLVAQAGLDIRPSMATNLGIGPFAMASLGRYSSVSCEPGAVCGELGANHHWFTFGVRATWVP